MTAQRPLIYLVVVLPLLVLGIVAPVLLVSMYATQHGLLPKDVPTVNALLVGLPGFFIWIPFALLVSNVILNAVPALRRIAVAYAAQADQPDYAGSQRQLLKALGLTSAVCVPLMLLGWWL
jgi:hypothetical protein